jgi:hypothetical protein
VASIRRQGENDDGEGELDNAEDDEAIGIQRDMFFAWLANGRVLGLRGRRGAVHHGRGLLLLGRHLGGEKRDTEVDGCVTWVKGGFEEVSVLKGLRMSLSTRDDDDDGDNNNNDGVKRQTRLGILTREQGGEGCASHVAPVQRFEAALLKQLHQTHGSCPCSMVASSDAKLTILLP